MASVSFQFQLQPLIDQYIDPKYVVRFGTILNKIITRYFKIYKFPIIKKILMDTRWPTSKETEPQSKQTKIIKTITVKDVDQWSIYGATCVGFSNLRVHFGEPVQFNKNGFSSFLN